MVLSRSLFVALPVVALGTTSEGGTLKLTWSDCGDSSTHGKVTGLAPETITLGQATTITGSGNLDEDVSDGSFTIDVKAGGGIVHQTYTGDICRAKTFNLPLGVGSVKWDGMKCPLSKGSISVPLDMSLSGSIPASIAKADIQATGKTSSGDKLLCLKVTAAKALEATAPLNCASKAYDFCCGIGTPCDCTKGTTAPGQCKPESWLYCCNVGTPCDCSQPPLAASNATVVV